MHEGFEHLVAEAAEVSSVDDDGSVLGLAAAAAAGGASDAGQPMVEGEDAASSSAAAAAAGALSAVVAAASEELSSEASAALVPAPYPSMRSAPSSRKPAAPRKPRQPRSAQPAAKRAKLKIEAPSAAAAAAAGGAEEPDSLARHLGDLREAAAQSQEEVSGGTSMESGVRISKRSTKGRKLREQQEEAIQQAHDQQYIYPAQLAEGSPFPAQIVNPSLLQTGAFPLPQGPLPLPMMPAGYNSLSLPVSLTPQQLSQYAGVPFPAAMLSTSALSMPSQSMQGMMDAAVSMSSGLAGAASIPASFSSLTTPAFALDSHSSTAPTSAAVSPALRPQQHPAGPMVDVMAESIEVPLSASAGTTPAHSASHAAIVSSSSSMMDHSPSNIAAFDLSKTHPQLSSQEGVTQPASGPGTSVSHSANTSPMFHAMTARRSSVESASSHPALHSPIHAAHVPTVGMLVEETEADAQSAHGAAPP